MRKRIQSLLHSHSGSISIYFVGLMFVLVVIVAILLELSAAYERHDYAIDAIQRAATTAVESTMDDDYRRDGIRKLRTVEAEGDAKFALTRDAFTQRIYHDLSSVKYSLNPDSFTYTFSEVPAGMTVSGEGSFKTVFSGFGFEDIHFSFSVVSSNYDTTDFEFDGVSP